MGYRKSQKNSGIFWLLSGTNFQLSSEIEQALFSETEIIILPSKSKFNRYKVPVELKSNSLYFVEIRQENNVEIPYFIIKDTLYLSILLKKSLESDVTQFVFATHNDVEGIEVFICPSYLQKNEEVGAIIEKCMIYAM